MVTDNQVAVLRFPCLPFSRSGELSQHQPLPPATWFWCALWIERFPSAYAAGAQQAAALQLSRSDLNDPKRSVATSDRTLPALPSSLPLSLLCHPPRPSWGQGALESPGHALHRLWPLNISSCCISLFVLWLLMQSPLVFAD